MTAELRPEHVDRLLSSFPSAYYVPETRMRDAVSLDRRYLEDGARELAVSGLLARALAEAEDR